MSKLLFALSFITVAAFAEPSVEVSRDGAVIRVDAVISVAVEPDLAWAVLTDYNHPADFAPDLLLSRVIGHEPCMSSKKAKQAFLSGVFLLRSYSKSRNGRRGPLDSNQYLAI